jgi:hypothetical protein
MAEGMRIEQGERDGILNAALPGATLDETATVLHLAMENPELRRVVWGVDFTGFNVHLVGFRDDGTRQRLAGEMMIRLRESLLSFETTADSWRVLLRLLGGAERLPESRRTPIPWPEDSIRSSLAGLPPNDLSARQPELDEHLKHWLDFYQSYQWSERQAHLYAETVAELHARGVEVILLVPPLSVYELEVIRRTGMWEVFERWKRELAKVGPYWDFSGYNAVALNDDFFTHFIISHFQAAVGHTILRAVLGYPCDRCGELAREIIVAGVWVDANTVEAHLRRQSLALQQYVEHQSLPSDAVARLQAASVEF